MIVVDASVAVDLLLRAPGADQLTERILSAGEALHAPHLLDVEVTQVLRRHAMSGRLSPARGRAAVDLLRAMPIVRHGHAALTARAWALRTNLTAYDAVYIALAEILDATLLTRDERLAAAPGHRARVEVR
ncbi:MAG: type II toxin-antitoxin system VapC family toxin [Gemmatimonadales bacterium]|nr:type II toxin-antitoxin system VapC family toxin [Gemmatimonadales bacterium]